MQIKFVCWGGVGVHENVVECLKVARSAEQRLGEDEFNSRFMFLLEFNMYAGSEVAQAAAQAALTTLSDVYKATRMNYRSLPRNTLQQDAGVASNGGNASDSIQGSLLHANMQLEKEESDVEKAISEIIEVQMKNIQDKLVNFEDLDLLMEEESQQLEQMKNLFFLDQLNLLFHKPSVPKTGECPEGNPVKTN